MRKYIKKITASFLLLVTLITLGSTLAAITTTKEVINKVSIDTVDIALDEYMYQNNQLVEFEHTKYVYPGDLISLVPQVKNKGVDAYIRIKLEFPQFRNKQGQVVDSLEILSLNNINGFDKDKWIYQNDHYYYVDILKEDQIITLFESIQIPTEWDNAYQSMSFDVNVEVDAIQARNFTPDYTSSTPWGNVAPEKTVRTRMDR